MRAVVKMPPDKRGVTRTFYILWTSEDHARVHVLLERERRAPTSYTYPSFNGEALRAAQIAKNPCLAKKHGAEVLLWRDEP